MPSLRTQIYLTRDQRRKLDARAAREGKTLAHVIRDAVELYVAGEPPPLETALRETFGSAPEFQIPSRSEWDRDLG